LKLSLSELVYKSAFQAALRTNPRTFSGCP
jgi:hypothetical protein